MEEKLERAIKVLAEKINSDVSGIDAQQYMQAVLNAANALCSLKSRKKI